MRTTVEQGEPPYIVTQGPGIFFSDVKTKRSPCPNGIYSASTKAQIAPGLLNQFVYEIHNTKTNVIDVNGLDPDSIRRFTRECAGMVAVVDGKADVFELVKTDPKTVEAIIHNLVEIVYERYDLDIEARRAAQDAKIARNMEALVAARLKAEPVLGRSTTEQPEQGETTEPVQSTEPVEPTEPVQSSESEE